MGIYYIKILTGSRGDEVREHLYENGQRLLKAQYDGMIIDIAGFNSKSASNSNFEEQLLLARPLHDEDLIRLNQVTMMMTGNTIFDDFSLKQYMLNKYGAVMVN